MSKKQTEKEARVKEIIGRLGKEYPDPKTVLKFANPFELLVATILSAQTTDTLVNKVTENLFKKYSSLQEYADADLQELQKDIGGLNFYKTKGKHIQEAARQIIESYGGEVPRTMEKLVSLPGVARKTANIVLSNAFGINEGVAVDTHVKRLSQRLGLTLHTDPVKIERDLISATPRKEWCNLSHLLIFHGRKVCTARNPRHDKCVLYDICPSRDI
jgi:endonuclease III